MTKTFAVLVTYNPDLEKLQAAINSILHQVDRLVVVDNGSGNIDMFDLAAENSVLEKLPNNMGIAYAQNVGIKFSIKHHANYVFLMDQDSIFAPDTVKTLLHHHQQLVTDGVSVGAIACAYRDTNSHQLNFIWRDTGSKVERLATDTSQRIEPVDFAISSGSLFHVPVFSAVGLMDSSLFIDLVDIEWGLRARSRGYSNFQVNECAMAHTIGDEKIKILGRSISVHTPIRDYYLIRNSVLLAKRKNLNPWWRKHLLIRSFLFFVIFSVFLNERKKRLYLMICGFRDGACNHAGRWSGR